MSANKSIILETESFAAKLIHHEELAKSSPENITNFANPLNSNIEAGIETFTFKETTSQPESLDFVEALIEGIGSHEDEKHWNLVRIRYINWNNTIMS